MPSVFGGISQPAIATPFDNTTNGFNAIDVQSAIEESKNTLTLTQITDTSNATTSSGTDVLLTTMTNTPVSGTWLVQFNGSTTSNAAGMAISFSIFVNGVQDAGSLIKVIPADGGALSSGSGRAVCTCIGTAVVNGSQAIEIRWSTSTGTATCHARRLILTRIA